MYVIDVCLTCVQHCSTADKAALVSCMLKHHTCWYSQNELSFLLFFFTEIPSHMAGVTGSEERQLYCTDALFDGEPKPGQTVSATTRRFQHAAHCAEDASGAGAVGRSCKTHAGLLHWLTPVVLQKNGCTHSSIFSNRWYQGKDGYCQRYIY